MDHHVFLLENICIQITKFYPNLRLFPNCLSFEASILAINHKPATVLNFFFDFSAILDAYFLYPSLLTVQVSEFNFLRKRKHLFC